MNCMKNFETSVISVNNNLVVLIARVYPLAVADKTKKNTTHEPAKTKREKTSRSPSLTGVKTTLA